jgi:DNA-binding transcriptional LysR family regulator
MAVELRHLRYFLALAAERHFERAAGQVGISQSALSQQIRKFEEELGFLLFTRSTHGVTITPAGEAMIADARAALERTERAVANARRVAAGQTGRIGIAFAGPTFEHLLTQIARDLRARHPDVEVALIEAPLADPTAPLRDERADVLLSRLPLPVSGVISRQVRVDRLLVVGNKPLADDEIDLSTLADETWLDWHDDLTERCDRHGFTPLVGAHAASYEGLLTLLAAGAGIALVPTGATLRPGLASTPVREETSTFGVAWREERRTALVDAALASAERAGDAAALDILTS